MRVMGPAHVGKGAVRRASVRLPPHCSTTVELSHKGEHSYAHQVLACLRHGSTLAADLPAPYASVSAVVSSLNRQMTLSGWHITSRTVRVCGKFFKHRALEYTLHSPGRPNGRVG